MNLSGILAENISANEVRIFERSSNALPDHLRCFRLLQDSFIQLAVDHINPLVLSNSVEPIQRLTYELTVTLFSMAQISMRIDLAGYARETASLSRTLSEITRVNTFLNFNPDRIEEYRIGNLRVTTILKLQGEMEEGDASFQMWKYLSNYAHATQDLLDQFSAPELAQGIVPFLIDNIETQEALASGIIYFSIMQYAWLRLVFRDLIQIPPQVQLNDEIVFLSELKKSIFGDEICQFLPVMHQAIYD